MKCICTPAANSPRSERGSHHTGAALRHGAKAEEIMEAIWVAAEMRAGGAYAHSALALDTIAKATAKQDDGAA